MRTSSRERARQRARAHSCVARGTSSKIPRIARGGRAPFRTVPRRQAVRARGPVRVEGAPHEGAPSRGGARAPGDDHQPLIARTRSRRGSARCSLAASSRAIVSRSRRAVYRDSSAPDPLAAIRLSGEMLGKFCTLLCGATALVGSCTSSAQQPLLPASSSAQGSWSLLSTVAGV